MTGSLCLSLLAFAAAGASAHAHADGFADDAAFMQATIGVHEHGEAASPFISKILTASEKMEIKFREIQSASRMDVVQRASMPFAMETETETIADDCDAEIPKYTISGWIQEHGYTMPDHPAVFLEDAVDPAFKQYANFDTFLSRFGDMPIEFYPEYGQPGGFGAHYPNHDTKTVSVKTMSQHWNVSHHAYSIFDCSSAICKEMQPFLKTPELFQGNMTSTNFLIGGPGGGLPFHKHEPTFQGLLSGRKLWYLVPPHGMTKEMHDITGPFMFPTRGWRKLVDGLPLGKRPLRCVQHPGEVLYFPDKWYHSTMNLDQFQLAWGGKPKDREVQHLPSAHLPTIMEHFPQSTITEDYNLPFFVTCRLADFKGTQCGNKEPDSHNHRVAGLERALKGIKERVLSTRDIVGNNALGDLAAFAICVSLTQVRDPALMLRCNQSMVNDMTNRWVKDALEMSSGTAFKECPKEAIAEESKSASAF